MNKKIVSLIFLCSFFAQAATEAEINSYIEARKAQLELQIREFDEAKQALEAYKASFEALQKEKMEALLKKEAEVNATLAKIEQTKKENENILAQTQKNLETINSKTQDRVKEIYSQMKDQSIADVLSQMDADEASKIMLSLEARKISGVLSKMTPQKASELTLLLKNLDSNLTQNTQEK
ncbi:nucleosidase [Campylobacter sp. MIT 99-7217]|uniref:MotE family protein n=1 Tax=Campylobacter sp. MIT 99-7217 TaxID=535091 RepID=UPI001159A203|nr:MotE family protein [Campylobacter sp. MIT 99-7217]TQR31880.1 nucleosidase [Campylobacter sp. MIT 99-7217]